MADVGKKISENMPRNEEPDFEFCNISSLDDRCLPLVNIPGFHLSRLTVTRIPVRFVSV